MIVTIIFVQTGAMSRRRTFRINLPSIRQVQNHKKISDFEKIKKNVKFSETMQLSAVRRGVQTPFMKWATQFLGGRTAAADEYMRYANYQAPRTYPARQTPPSQNEKLHCKSQK